LGERRAFLDETFQISMVTAADAAGGIAGCLNECEGEYDVGKEREGDFLGLDNQHGCGLEICLNRDGC
jgi:hypothetical protein